MRVLVLALACLPFAGHGHKMPFVGEEIPFNSQRQPHASHKNSVDTGDSAELKQLNSKKIVDVHNTLKALAKLMVVFKPVAGWQVPSATHVGSVAMPSPSGYHATLNPSMKIGQQSSAGDWGKPLSAPYDARVANAPQMIWAPQLETEDSIDTSLPAGLTCKVSLNVGRESGSWMPADWAASGARLLLPLSLTFSNEQVGNEGNRENMLGPREQWRRLVVNGVPSFVSSRGLEHVAVQHGAWSLIPSGHESGQLLFRFYLDFPEGAVRNDVELPAGRVFFSSGAWPEAELAAASQRTAELEKDIAKLREEFEEKVNLRKGNPLQRAQAVRVGTTIVDQLRLKERTLEYLMASMPSSDGALQVPDGVLRLNKVGGLSVKRRGPARRFFAEEYHVIGTFTFADLVSSQTQSEHETELLAASTP